MNMIFRHRRGNAIRNERYVGKPGELTIDMERKAIRIHDGITPGGSFKLTEGGTTNTTTDIDAQNTPLLTNEGFGWRDITSEIRVSGNGNANPNWTAFRNGIFAYEFQSSRANEFWCTFHIDHDYALGTKVFPHIHWATNSTATGSVRWGIEYAVAKGHAQASGSIFGPSSLIYVTSQVTPGSQFRHYITEVPEALAIPASQLEPDSLILVRFFRDGVNDTLPASVHAFTADVHYQVARISTRNKAPNFYT